MVLLHKDSKKYILLTALFHIFIYIIKKIRELQIYERHNVYKKEQIQKV